MRKRDREDQGKILTKMKEIRLKKAAKPKYRTRTTKGQHTQKNKKYIWKTKKSAIAQNTKQ
jgi:hypothetical protein